MRRTVSWSLEVQDQPTEEPEKDAEVESQPQNVDVHDEPVSETTKDAENNGPNFKTSDQAFLITAKLVTDYLSPKLKNGVSSYHVDESDMIYLDAVVPNEIRPNFVDAIGFRATKLSSNASELSPIESSVKECVRLGLDKKDTFLLGGGMKMPDGRILVLPGGNKLGVKKKSKKKKKKKPVTETKANDGAPQGDAIWLQNSGLPPDQIQLIMSAMSSQQGGTKTTEAVEPEAETATEEKAKIPMDRGRRKRTSKGQAMLPPISTNKPNTASRSLTPKRIGRKSKDNDNGILRSSSNIGIKQTFSSSSMAQKDVIGGLKRNDSTVSRSTRSLSRRMRSIERRSKVGLYVEDTTDEESPLKSNWRDDIWDFAAHGIFHKFLILSFIAPLCKFCCLTIANVEKTLPQSLSSTLSFSCPWSDSKKIKTDLAWCPSTVNR